MWGSGNITSGMFSTAAGLGSESSGDYSFALGEGLVSNSYGQVTVGRFNELRINQEGSLPNATDELFVVGSGGADDSRKNSITVLKNGNVGVGKDGSNARDVFTIHHNQEGRLETSTINSQGEVFHEYICSAQGDSYVTFSGAGHIERGLIRYNAEDDALQLYTLGFGGGSPFMNFKIGGIGINESDPAYDLHMGSNSAAKPSSSSWTVASDRRLKEDVRSFEDGLSIIQKINPVWFTYNGKARMPRESGVGTIAQELEKVAPYMVTEWERDGETYKAVDYGAMDFILINAVKEQQEQIDKYEERIAKLEALVEELMSEKKVSSADK